FKYLHAEDLAQPNLARVQQLIQIHGRRSGQRLPQFPRDAIEQIVNYVTNLTQYPTDSQRDLLINLRDRGLILTLADTGLRIHEVLNLRRGDIDWNEGRAIVIGKGDQEAIVRFSTRSMRAIRQYLQERGALDGGSGKPLPTLPLFARHDKRAGTNVLSLSTTSGRNIVEQRVRECLGEDAVGTITPHSFRHYFVTTVLRGSGGNLKMAQDLARHKNIQVTQRYAHLSEDELDKTYHEIFNA
ncbi:MAG: site-specific integrase, partial [Anaerolineales bacterium]|nr:site-specific integrase [Anaerolineales bacterium]